MTNPFDRHHFDYAPWEFWTSASEAEKAEQLVAQQILLSNHPGVELGERVFISTLAAVQPERLVLGDRTTVAAHAHVSGDVQTGADCTINVSCAVRGSVVLGDGVRIGTNTSIIGFNHSFEPGLEVFRQPLTSKGIWIGDDVWIGANVTIVDGVTIGSGSVVGGGSVVTKDVPAGAIVAGNPARVKGWRSDPVETTELRKRLAEFSTRFAEDLERILARAWRPGLNLFADRPDRGPSLRAQCDAIELSFAVSGMAPPQLATAVQEEFLAGLQDSTGLFADIDPSGKPHPATDFHDGDTNYRILSVGYALELLGARPTRLIQYPLDVGRLVNDLGELPWRISGAWSAGHFVDAVGTALRWNLEVDPAAVEAPLNALFGWLTTNVDPTTGMWGEPAPDDDLLQIVNGYYRATRGTFAQFGVPLPLPERAIDTVLTHSANSHYFDPADQNACNVLDVVHPLWLLGKQTNYRRAEAEAVVTRLLTDGLGHYRPGSGFGFAPSDGGSVGESELVNLEVRVDERVGGCKQTKIQSEGERIPSLQGTEMWASIIWLAADYLGISEELSWSPKGVHQPEPAVLLRKF